MTRNLAGRNVMASAVIESPAGGTLSFSHTNLWLLAFSIEATELRADCPFLAERRPSGGHSPA